MLKCWSAFPNARESQGNMLTVDGDDLPVLQDDVPSGHLHRDNVGSFPGEGEGDASIQGNHWLHL